MTQRALRFLFLTQYYAPEPGAASLRLEAMAHELIRAGHQVSVVTAQPHHLGTTVGPRRRVFTEDVVRGVPVIRTWIWRVPLGKRFWWRLANYFSFVVTSFGGLLRNARPDYLVVESPPLFLGMTARLYSRLFHVPYILSVSDLWPESAVALGLVHNPVLIRMTKHLELSLYAHARFVSAVTEGIRQAVVDTKKIPATRVLFFPNGVDLDKFPAVPPAASLIGRLHSQGWHVFLYPGTIGYAQGLNIIIDAALRLRGTSVAFLLVGDGPVKTELMARVQSEGLENVWFEDLQPVEKMPEYFALARGVVVPLRNHPLFKGARPSKVFPSWSAKVPVIFAGEGEMAELVMEAGGGMVVRPEDGVQLARAVTAMATMDNEQWQAMGQAGWNFVHDHYTWQHIAERWLESLEQEAP